MTSPPWDADRLRRDYTGPHYRAAFPFPVQVAFWLQALSIGMAVIGTILVGAGQRCTPPRIDA